MKIICIFTILGFFCTSWLRAQNPMSNQIDSLSKGLSNNLSLNLRAFKSKAMDNLTLKNFELENFGSTVENTTTPKPCMPIYGPQGHFPMVDYPIDNKESYSLKIYEPQ